MCYITDRQKGVKYAMWKHRTKPLAAATARGFLFIYLRLSFALRRMGRSFFVIHKRARNCIMLMRVWDFSF